MTTTAPTMLYDGLEAMPRDPVLGIAVGFRDDPSPNKVNLGIGAYRTEDGKAHVFEVVRKVESDMAADIDINKEYCAEDGIPALKELTQKLIFGEASDRVATAQSLSGTGCLFLAGTFINAKVSNSAKVYVSCPTWPNHKGVFGLTGFEVVEYPYWNQATRSLDIEGMLTTLRAAPERSLVVLHACAHNPTGLDPDTDQWRQVLEVVTDRKLIPILDCAYQGFASGDLEKDTYSIRLFFKAGVEFFVAQSFAKNMGLYGERMGALHAICADAAAANVVITHLKVFARRIYSSPAINGGRIVERILSNPAYDTAWRAELKEVAGRILHIRQQLRDGLVAKGTPGNWDHITKQIGMFSFTGLTPEQCARMIEKWHVHMMPNGRISLSGLNKSNVGWVVDAIDDCVRNG